jgi:dihydrofolate reductase
MRKLAVNTFVSLDGVMQAPGGPEEDPTGGFTLGGWSANYFDDEMMGQVAEADPYELLLGRGTYEIFAAHWPYAEGPIADRLNSTRKHVASTTLERVEWSNSTLITGDVAEYVASLKRQDGPEIQVHGSPGLIQTLLEHDLIDELRVWIFPVVIGTGRPRPQIGRSDLGIAPQDRQGAHGHVAAPLGSGRRRIAREVDGPAAVVLLPVDETLQLGRDGAVGPTFRSAFGRDRGRSAKRRRGRRPIAARPS